MRMMHWLNISCSNLLLFACAHEAPSVVKDASLPTPLASQLAPYIADGSFSGTLAYQCSAKSEAKVFAFGRCDREMNLDCKPDTKFRIGSMSKSFTAAAILNLAETESLSPRLSIDDKVSKWIPEYPAGNLVYEGEPVLIRHLLAHTGGIPAFEGTAFFKKRAWVSVISLEERMQAVRDLPLVTMPGTAYSYSNTGYALLALIVERASGQSFENYLEKNILNKVPLTQTGIVENPHALPGEFAKGYAKDGDSGEWYSLYDWSGFKDRNLSLASGSGSLFSNAQDSLGWIRSFAAGRIVSPASVAMAFKPNLQDYGFGWTASYIRNTKLHWHNGALSPLGFSSEMGIHSVAGFAYTLLTNVNDNVVSKEATDIVYSFLIDQCGLD